MSLWLGTVASSKKFSPNELASLRIWIDSADTSTITASGSPLKVSQVNDKSGYSNHVTQATSSLQPITGQSTQNGLNVINASNNLLSNSYKITAPHTAFVVYRHTSEPQTILSIFFGTTNSARGIGAGWNTTSNTYNTFIWAGSESQRAIAFDSGYVVQSITISSSWSHFVTINGDSGTATGTGSFNIDNNYIAINNGGFGLLGNFSESLVFNEELSLINRQKVEGYLAHKWGIASKLPLGHPYRAIAP